MLGQGSAAWCDRSGWNLYMTVCTSKRLNTGAWTCTVPVLCSTLPCALYSTTCTSQYRLASLTKLRLYGNQQQQHAFTR